MLCPPDKLTFLWRNKLLYLGTILCFEIYFVGYIKATLAFFLLVLALYIFCAFTLKFVCIFTLRMSFLEATEISLLFMCMFRPFTFNIIFDMFYPNISHYYCFSICKPLSLFSLSSVSNFFWINYICNHSI